MKNQLKTILFLGVLSAVLVSLGGYLGTSYLYTFLALAMVMNLGAYFFSDRIVLAIHRAREIPVSEAPELHATVEELAGRAGLPKPRVYLIPSAQPNAFATGRNPERAVVAVTSGILQILDHRELRGVLAHELAHVKNRDILLTSVAAVLASTITYIAHALSFAAIFGRNDEDRQGSALSGLLVAIVAPIAATLIQLAISRSREYLADETGARLAGDPEALASALGKLHHGSMRVPMRSDPSTASLFIVNPLAGTQMAWIKLFSTHPPIEERVERLLDMARSGVDRWGMTRARRTALSSR